MVGDVVAREGRTLSSDPDRPTSPLARRGVPPPRRKRVPPGILHVPGPAPRLRGGDGSGGAGVPRNARIRRHVPTLRREKLATDRAVTLLEASDGTLLEIFEWVPGGAERAHSNPAVLAIWGPMHECADFATLASLPESGTAFPHFRPADGVVA